MPTPQRPGQPENYHTENYDIKIPQLSVPVTISTEFLDRCHLTAFFARQTAQTPRVGHPPPPHVYRAAFSLAPGRFRAPFIAVS